MDDEEYSPVDLQNPDESRPAKRARLDASLTVTEETQQEMAEDDDWDDIYDESTQTKPATAEAANTAVTVNAANADHSSNGTQLSTTAPSTLPEHQFAAEVQHNKDEKPPAPDGIPAEAISEGDDLVAPPQPAADGLDKASIDVIEETTKIEYEPVMKQQELEEQDKGKPANIEQEAKSAGQAENRDILGDGTAQTRLKAIDDPEFMAAAAAQKSKTNAEWQFDSSDAESSSDSDSSSDDSSDESDSGSEGGYEMLDPATAAKILMSGDDGDDEGGKGKDRNGADNQPRTTNEIKEEVVVKPDIEITPDMQIVLLGHVDRTVENMVLIKGATPGEMQVLESGSVLCNEKREVIGAIADTFGRVQEPLYSVAFSNAKEIEEAGLEYGTKIFYVIGHHKFVFTQPLKNMKGTDASNIHDEEVGEDEMEFSDDEAEAEFKRQKKLAKKAGRGGLSRSAFQQGTRITDSPGTESSHTFGGGASDVPTQTYGGGMSYDDNEPAEDFYQPLKRPDNLSDLMAGRDLPARPPLPNFDRGRGRGRGDRGRGDRGRGRGDRGRGRGSFEHRGGRGGGPRGHHQQGNEQYSLPPRPTAPPSGPPQGSASSPTQYAPTNQWAPSQFNGYPAYNSGQPSQMAAPQQTAYWQQPTQPTQQQYPAGSTPAGAYVNPAFFQQQANPQQQQQAYAAWQAYYQQQQNAYAQGYAAQAPAAGGAQPQQQAQPPPAPPPDLGDILKRLQPGS